MKSTKSKESSLDNCNPAFSEMMKGSVDFIKEQGDTVVEIVVRPKPAIGHLTVRFELENNNDVEVDIDALSCLSEDDYLLQQVKEAYEQR